MTTTKCKVGGCTTFPPPVLYEQRLCLEHYLADIHDRTHAFARQLANQETTTELEPAIVQFVGGTVDRALAVTREMLEITWAQNPALTLPCLH
ncbi:MAG: hypothetical protein IH793_08900, partial [Acidobacteria bacterium]|nr:hypothetical protein [Acidobacteriota bacterium]